MDSVRSQQATVTQIASSQHAVKTLHHSVPERTDNRMAELTSQLQTTLELDLQIDLFSQRIGRWFLTDGTRYRHEEQAIGIELGRTGGHRVSYNLVLEEQDLGTIEFHRARPFAEQELGELETLLCTLVYPLRNALAYRSAVERALRDPLTGVQNRAALTAAVEREVENAQRHGTPLAMLVLDIDCFKSINDNYGHSVGDDVLRAVAQTTETTIRKADQLFRYGGEEFVILASYTDEDGARQLAERIRRDIESIGAINGRDIDITASLGISLMPPGQSCEDLFERADQALYQAKQSGRNCWVVAD